MEVRRFGGGGKGGLKERVVGSWTGGGGVEVLS